MGDQGHQEGNDLHHRGGLDVEAASTIADDIADLDEHTHYSQRAPWLR